MVEVFKTNVSEHYQAEKIFDLLIVSFPDCKINFDLEDVDKILRIEGTKIISKEIIELINAKGYFCEVLN